MNSLAQINDMQVSIINFKSIPVITTAMLANFYGTENIRIQQNHTRNLSRFIEGKHFFKLIGEELKIFKKTLTSLKIVSQNAKHLILWTERGAARHAKMLDTDQAWDVFEQLEDCYFRRQEILAKTHKSERTALHEAHALLVTKTKHLNVNEAWKLIHQRFNVGHIEDIPFDMIPAVVEYVHHLIALFSGMENKGRQEPWANADVQVFMYYAPILGKFVRDQLYPALVQMKSSYASQLVDITQELATSANAMNRFAWGNGVTYYDKLEKAPLHTMEWYLSKH